MAAAGVGLPSALSGLTLENLPLARSANASSSSLPLVAAGFSRNAANERKASLKTRCEVRSVSETVQDEKKMDSRAASVSALEQLKTSAAERYMKERSTIVVLGVSVHTTPVEMREKLAIPEAEWPRAIEELCALNHIEEAAVLSTCNRMEIYVVALSWHRGIREVTDWMAKTSGIPVSDLRQHLFLLRDNDATQHLFEVSAGLDSLILGEGQILAQVKQVVNSCQGVVGFGRYISGLFKHAITVGKRVRDETKIASGAVSVSSAAVELALMKLPKSEAPTARMLVIGAGKMGKIVIKHLVAKGFTRFVVVNRSEDRVAAIREELKDAEIIYKPMSEMVSCAADADVVFTSTKSEMPLFLKEHVENLPPVSQEMGGLRLFVDISVPRNVGPCVSMVKSAQVYNVDDLEEVVNATKEDRQRKAMEAETIIVEESKKFEAWRDSLETVPTIRKLRSYMERIRVSELEKCLSKLGDDLPNKKKKAVDDLSKGIMNKILHGPMKHLRYDGNDDRSLSEILENMNALNRIFSLETEISVLEQKIRNKIEQTQK